MSNPTAHIQDADCERCGQPGTRQNPVFRYFAEGRLFHTSCFEAYADEVLAQL